MSDSVPVLIILVLLSSCMSMAAPGDSAITEQSDYLGELKSERVEIAPDPNSIKDLGSPEISFVGEGLRARGALSSIGEFSDIGFDSNLQIPESLTKERPDLLIVLVDPNVGLWESREQIIESGDVAVRSLVPPSGFLIQGSEVELSKVKSLPLVRSTHGVPVAMVIDKDLWSLEQQQFSSEILGWKNNDLVRLDTPGHGSYGSLSETAERFLSDMWSPTNGVHFGILSSEQLLELAMSPEVSYISHRDEIILHNNNARVHTGANAVESYYITSLNGNNQRVAVADSGLDDDHGDFGSRIVGLVDVAGDGNTNDPNDSHGTHVACTVLGSGSRSTGSDVYQGVAPEAKLYFQAMEGSGGGLAGPGIFSLLNSAYSSGNARIHTNSWGSLGTGGDYTTQSEDADDRTSTWDQYWTYDGMTVLFAAGNERDDGVSAPGTAKNVITVGGHVNRYSSSEEMYYWSSWGPTDDGRIKPDIVAPGDYVRSCRAQESNTPKNVDPAGWYLEYSGTSMATPAAAGASAIVRQYLMEIAERPAPQGALVKAMLILGAEDMSDTDGDGVQDPRDIPNAMEGWGRLNLANTLVPDGDIGTFVDDRSRLRSGEQAEYNFEVTRSGEPLKVVLAWSDYPGSAFTSTQLRNDLNLEVTSPNGQVTYIGNDFQGGKSKTGGSKDDKNNVEVVLIDSASIGIWNVKVIDYSHGGGRTYQPFAIAVRGVNVNDLTPDPTFVPTSFEISTPIPQVGDEVQFSATILNQGSGSFPEVHVSAYGNDDLIGTKTLGMLPAESIELEWDWMPTQADATAKNVTIRLEIDPNNQLEELYEDNNVLETVVQVSAPGIQASSDEPWITLLDANDITTKWSIQMTNLALFETNASISVSNPTRLADGKPFSWFTSFDKVFVNLGPSASTSINLTMVHPGPPQPGTYSLTVTATDVEYDIESQLDIYFDVPVLAQPTISLPSETIIVDPFQNTSLSVDVVNDGNGAQTYDLELVPPAGWDIGFDELGAFPGSKKGSTGTLEKGGHVPAGITIVPPGMKIDYGHSIVGQMLVKSRVGADVWSKDLNLVVGAFDSLSFTPESGLDQDGIRSDSLHEITLEISNDGNRDLVLTPLVTQKPGGWTVASGLNNLQVPKGGAVNWELEIQGNGLANGGLLELKLLGEDGSSFIWNVTLGVVSGALPVVEFHQLVVINGSSVDRSDAPLGLGAYPVGESFDMGWRVTNQGTASWEFDASMILPNDQWTASCLANKGKIGAGESTIVWCSIVIPISESAGSEPNLELVLSGEGIEERTGETIIVRTVKAVSWTMVNINDAHEGFSTTLYYELQNIGNSPISSRLVTDGPSGWNVRIIDGIMVTLQPGEAKSVQVAFTPDSSSDGVVSITLIEGEEISGSSTSIQIEVISESTKGDSGNMLIVGAGLFLLTMTSVLLISMKRPDLLDGVLRGAKDGTDLKESENWKGGPEIEAERGTVEETSESSLEKYEDYPGWLWDPAQQEWVPDPESTEDGHGNIPEA